MAGSDLIAWCCTYLDELRDVAETEAQRAELEACVAAAARGEDCTDRLGAVLRSMGQEVEASRGGGYVMLPGLQGGKGAVLRAVCPNGVCSRDAEAGAPEERRRCSVQGAVMPEKWTSPS
ncbi:MULTISPECIES: hypothetical protein [unclassified Streptomyces]|uniref:hypothetical protein n=1 Tax=unclassified Streptomyces TaxID=2593676 RepID=UPI001C227B62|nr:hypothetical protein [Streptomyces sp. AC558_RSS880]